MAFVADFNEEELQRALAAQGGAPAVASGPASASASGPSAGPAVPQGAAPGSAPGGDPQGTGFVNLSRYFDANQAGADAAAAKLMDPLKSDLGAVAQAGQGTVAMPSLPPPLVGDPSNPENRDWENSNAQAATDYEKALAQWEKDTVAAGKAAQQTERVRQEGIASGIANDPNKRNEAMSLSGQNPSAFDSYLAGAAMPGAYQGLRDFYGNALGSGTTGTEGRTPNPGSWGTTGSGAGPDGIGGGSAGSSPRPPAPSGGVFFDPAARKRKIGGW